MSGLANVTLSASESRRVRFRLRRMTDGAFLNVNGAESIRVDFRQVGGVNVPSAFCERLSGYDDWVNGLVTVIMSPSNVSSIVGSYTYRLVWARGVGDDDETPIFDGGRCEVTPNATTFEAKIPGVGSYTPDRMLTGVVGNEAIVPGVVVTVTGKSMGRAPTGTTKHLGVAVNSPLPGQSGAAAASGAFTLIDWTAAIGAPSLTPGANYGVVAPGILGVVTQGAVAVAETPQRLRML